jgi:MarR family transcriptional regulator for hemolysin
VRRNAASTKHDWFNTVRLRNHLANAGYGERMHRQQHLGFLLDNVGYLYARRFEEHARRLSLTLHECKVLAVIGGCEGINQTQLGQTSDILPTNLVRILDRLEAGGWAQRRPDPQDRRAHLLILNESAQPVVERIWHVVSQTNAEALNGLASGDLSRLTEGLARVHANLAALGPLHLHLQDGHRGERR